MLPPIAYKDIVAQFEAENQTARIKASLSADEHLLISYWKVGKAILQHQDVKLWGAKIIDNLSRDLRIEFPDMKGTSQCNLKYMRAFAEVFPQSMHQPAAQIAEKESQQAIRQSPNEHIVQVPLAQLKGHAIRQAPLAQIKWYHHITLLEEVKDSNERLYYIQKAAENGWCRDVMVHQIIAVYPSAKALPSRNSRKHFLNLRAT